jgi:hypothetical protein
VIKLLARGHDVVCRPLQGLGIIDDGRPRASLRSALGFILAAPLALRSSLPMALSSYRKSTKKGRRSHPLLITPWLLFVSILELTRRHISATSNTFQEVFSCEKTRALALEPRTCVYQDPRLFFFASAGQSCVSPGSLSPVRARAVSSAVTWRTNPNLPDHARKKARSRKVDRAPRWFVRGFRCDASQCRAVPRF